MLQIIFFILKLCIHSISENTKQKNAIVIIINYELHESHKWQTYFPFKTVVLKLFITSTTSENIWLSKYHHNDQH